MFLKPFSPSFFRRGAFFALANGHELLPFFADIFQLKFNNLQTDNVQSSSSFTKHKRLTIVQRGNVPRNFFDPSLHLVTTC